MTDLQANVERHNFVWVEDSHGGEWREDSDNSGVRHTIPTAESGNTWLWEPSLTVTLRYDLHIEPDRASNQPFAENVK
jgi:hypothetical protein